MSQQMFAVIDHQNYMRFVLPDAARCNMEAAMEMLRTGQHVEVEPVRTIRPGVYRRWSKKYHARVLRINDVR